MSLAASHDCVQACISVCKGIDYVHSHAWFIPLVFALGFITGKFDLCCHLSNVLYAWKAHSTPVKREERVNGSKGPKPQGGMMKVREAPVKPPKVRKSKSPEAEGKNSKISRSSLMKLEESPKSDCSTGSTSPLFLGTTKSSVESSPLSTSSESPRERTFTSSLVEVEDGASVSETGPGGCVPLPLVIPAYSGGQDSCSSVTSVSLHSFEDRTLPAVAWMCGKDIQFRNESWLDLVERNLDFVYGKEWVSSVHPDDLSHCQELVAVAPNAKAPFQMEYRLKLFSDTFRWILDIVKPRMSAGGELLGFVGWRVDIHDRKMIEEKYWSYWHLPHEFLVNWSGDGRYFDGVSTGFPSFLGYTIEEFKAQPYMSFVHPDDKARTFVAASQLKEGKPVINFVNRYRCGKDVTGPVYVDSTGKYKYIMWISSSNVAAGRDITSVKLAEEELRESQRDLKRITDLIPGGVFSYRVTSDGQESFPYLSKGASGMLATTDEKVRETRRAFGMTVCCDDWDSVRTQLDEASVSDVPFDQHFRVETGCGGHRWVRVHAVAEKQLEGAVVWSGIALDMTLECMTLESLKEARENAERAAQAKAMFLAHMSHEIRTPLNSVIGMCTLLLGTELTDEQHEYTSTVRHSGEALLAVINDVLDFSKIEAGKMELELRPTKLWQCAEEAFDIIAPQACSKSLELTYSISEKVPKIVMADINRVRQILVNLLGNAVKFTACGGISLRVDGRQVGNEDQRLWEIQLSVKDSGAGIPHSRKDSLFQSFTQADVSTSRKYGGTGLGLVICARLCKLHGGHIWVESELGAGSTFHFTITAEEFPTPDVEENNGLQGKRVLVVDKYCTRTQTMCSETLKSFEIEALCPESTGEALTLLEKMNSTMWIDAVIFNNSVFDAGDHFALECVKLCAERPQPIPTIILLSFGDSQREYHYPNSSEAICFDASISKPVKVSSLRNALLRFGARDGVEQKLKDSEASTFPRKSSKMSETCPLSILVAEDNPINQKVIVKLLERLGYTADVASNGVEALNMALHNHYDVCFMDCYMPDMDGLEASRRIKEEAAVPPIIVAVTAAALEEEIQQCFQAGMDLILFKPLRAEELKCALQKCWEMIK